MKARDKRFEERVSALLKKKRHSHNTHFSHALYRIVLPRMKERISLLVETGHTDFFVSDYNKVRLAARLVAKSLAEKRPGVTRFTIDSYDRARVLEDDPAPKWHTVWSYEIVKGKKLMDRGVDHCWVGTNEEAAKLAKIL